MMWARSWRSSPRKTRVGSPAIPSASMAARSSEFLTRATCAVDRREFSDRNTSETLSFNLVAEFAVRRHIPGREGTDCVLWRQSTLARANNTPMPTALSIRDASCPHSFLEGGTAIGEVLAIRRYLEEAYPKRWDAGLRRFRADLTPRSSWGCAGRRRPWPLNTLTARSGGFDERQRRSLCVPSPGHVVVLRHHRHGRCSCHHVLCNRCGADPALL